MKDNFTFVLDDENATISLAQNLAKLASVGDVIYLKGTLGMGKSTFARAFIRFLSGDMNLEVPSPTFTLAQTYMNLTPPVWHFDLYRLESPEEVEEIGIYEALSSAVSLIEWPERLGRLSFSKTLRLTLELDNTSDVNPNKRIVHLSGDDSWQERLKKVVL